MKRDKIRFRRRSVAMTWLLSYILVLFVPIAINLAVYWQTEKTVENQIKRGNDTLLLQMQEAVDNEVSGIRRLVSQIYANEKVQNLFYSNKANRGDYRFDLYEILQDLKGIRSAYSMYEEFYIYWSDGGRVIMPTVYKPADEAYADLYQGGNLSFTQWLGKVNSINRREFILTSRRTEEGALREYATYISSFPADSNDQPAGSIVIMLNAEQLLKIIGNVRLFNSGSVFIINERNEVLTSTLKDEKDLSPLGPLPDSQGNKAVVYRGEPSHIYYVKSTNSELTYATIVPDRVVWKESQYVRKLTYSSIAFSLTGGILLTYVFLRRNYQPLGRLIQTFSQKVNGVAYKEANEFAYIEEVLAKTLDEKDQASLRMKQQTNQLRGNFISRLLKGRIEASIPQEEARAAFQLHFESEEFCVLLLYLEENEAFFERIGGLPVPDRLKLLEFIVTNVVEEVLNRSHHGYMAEVDDMMACLINLAPGPKDRALADIRAAAEEAVQFLKRQYAIGVTVALSGVHTATSGIPEAYKESLDVMEYKLVMGRRDIMAYGEMQKEQADPVQSGYYYPLQVEQHLMNVVKAGDLVAAQGILNDILSRNMNEAALTVEQMKCLMFDLISTLMKTVQELGETNAEFLQQVHRAFERLTGMKTVKEMHHEMLSMLEEVCAYTAARQESMKRKWKSEEQDGFIRSVAHYIEDHYRDVNLNITMIGEAFGMKPTYLSKLFKDHTGEGLLDTINKMRIHKAKQLLKEEKLTVAEVMGLCGFNDLNTFSRSFKKWEGVTPGQYKNISQP
ncbi:AraC family transcriptional regulator [Gorillibacterium sp. sgz5001074]|uniref:AraC family transcriptional regulator n=1 Tax=Gorillibacterium sp. sgz5001074 TaxID=3446695 RepID=UPI003F670206